MSSYPQHAEGNSIGWRWPIKVRGNEIAHGYASLPQLADDTDKPRGTVTVRYASGDSLGEIAPDGTGQDLDELPMSAISDYPTSLVFTIYDTDGMDGNYQLEGTILLADPSNSSSTLTLKVYENFAIANGIVQGS